jgi:hypothetical protein
MRTRNGEVKSERKGGKKALDHWIFHLLGISM